VLASGGLVLGACGPARVSLAQLADQQEQYAGQAVTVAGTVRHFTDGGGYDVLEDAQQHRVLLQPASAVAGRVGTIVTVTGRFSVDAGVGRVISVASVSASAS
jgi:hypothetical protein